MKSWQRARLATAMTSSRGASGRTKANVILDGVIEQVYALEHHRYVCKQAFRRSLADINAADGNVTLIDIPKARKQIHQRRFTRALGPTSAQVEPSGIKSRYVRLMTRRPSP